MALKRPTVAPAEGLLTEAVLKHARVVPNRRPWPLAEAFGRLTSAAARRTQLQQRNETTSFSLLVSPSLAAAMSVLRPSSGIPRPRGCGHLETAPMPCGSLRFRDRVPKPPTRRLIGSFLGKPPSRSWSRSDGPACRSRFRCRGSYRRRSRSAADTRRAAAVQTPRAGRRGTALSPYQERRVRRQGDLEADGVARPACGRLLARSVEPGATAPDDKAVDVIDDRDRNRVPCQDRLQRRAVQADDGGETAVARRGRIHHRRPPVRHTQSARPVEGAGTPPGREFADAVAGDHGARRPNRAERCPRSQGLRAARDLLGEVREQVCRSGWTFRASLPGWGRRTGRAGRG